MRKRTEIIDQNDKLIERIEDILDLKKDDEFYFSYRGTTPSSEIKFREIMTGLNPEVVDKIIEDVKDKAAEYHIKKYKVTKVSNSLEISNSISIDIPSSIFTRSITVKEI